MEIMTSLGDKAAAAAKSRPKGNHEGRQAWETRRQRHHDHLAISEMTKKEGLLGQGSSIMTRSSITKASSITRRKL